jgi:acetylglutamate kinase
MEPADVVLRFLESVGSRRESDFYLALFRAGEPERFAAISVDANVARHAAEAVTLDLRFLAALGLYPVVLLGLFESTEAMEHAIRLGRRLEKAGVKALLLGSEEPDLIERAAEAARAQTIPIVAFPVGASSRFEQLGTLVAALRTRKLIFLHRPGGLRQGGDLVPLVNLTTDFATVSQSKELSRKERALVEESRRLVERTPHRVSVAITSPLNLFRELFTIKGAGTLLRRGALIERRRFADLDPSGCARC